MVADREVKRVMESRVWVVPALSPRACCVALSVGTPVLREKRG